MKLIGYIIWNLSLPDARLEALQTSLTSVISDPDFQMEGLRPEEMRPFTHHHTATE